MNKTKLVDAYEVKESSYSVTSAPVTNTGGFHILGKLTGPHFVPDGTSRNQRYYSRSLWERVLNDEKTREKLDRRLMFGTIGHADDFDVEKFAREGLLSHVTVNMWIDEATGLGMAEDWILDTPAGKNLYAMCKAGCRFYTSSRASGSFKEEKLKGMPVVDEDTYDLGGWDMVVDPGFLEADPSLVESLKRNGVTFGVHSIPEKTKTDGGTTMSTELIEKLTKEKIAVENGLREALQELNAYKKIGTPQRIREALKAYMALGSPTEINKAFDVAEASIKKLQGSMKKYENLGSIPDIEKALKVAESMLNKYKVLGTPEDIEEALDKATVVFNEYKVLGTPKEIDEALEKATSMARISKKSKNEAMAKRLAKAYKAPFKTAYALVEKLGAKEAERMLKSLREEDESGYRLGIEWPGNPADDTLMQHYDDEGEVILGDVVGPEGTDELEMALISDEEEEEEGEEKEDQIDLDAEETEVELETEEDEINGILDAEEEDEEDDDTLRKQEALRRNRRRLKESRKKKKGYKQLSVFERLVSKK